jgi:hypothetical protein
MVEDGVTAGAEELLVAKKLCEELETPECKEGLDCVTEELEASVAVVVMIVAEMAGELPPSDSASAQLLSVMPALDD